MDRARAPTRRARPALRPGVPASRRSKARPPLPAAIRKLGAEWEMQVTPAFVLVLTLVLTGCGFQPRGALDLPGPPGAMAVRGGPPELREALNVRLVGGGAQLAAEDAGVVLDVRSARFGERLLTVEPVTGGAVEYQVSYHVRYTVTDRGGKAVLEPGQVDLRREYRVHAGERATRDRERARIHDEMHRSAAAAILRRLHALSGG